MAEKVLVLVSGGLDSTTCLAREVKRVGSENVVALSIYYGQKHDKEIASAKAVTDYYHVEWLQLNLTKIFQFSNSSLLSHSDVEIPKESYGDQLAETDGELVSTYVPFRNDLFLSSAASMAHTATTLQELHILTVQKSLTMQSIQPFTSVVVRN